MAAQEVLSVYSGRFLISVSSCLSSVKKGSVRIISSYPLPFFIRYFNFVFYQSVKPEKQQGHRRAYPGGNQKGKRSQSVAGSYPDKKFYQKADGRNHQTQPNQPLDEIQDLFRAGFGISCEKPGYFSLKAAFGMTSPFHKKILL